MTRFGFVKEQRDVTVAVIGPGYVLDITPHAARVGVAKGVLRFDNDGDHYVNKAFGYYDVLDLPRE